jgi:hypothetical protein
MVMVMVMVVVAVVWLRLAGAAFGDTPTQVDYEHACLLSFRNPYFRYALAGYSFYPCRLGVLIKEVNL